MVVMGVLKKSIRPLEHGGFLVLKMSAGLEVSGMSQVFPLFRDIDNGGGEEIHEHDPA